MSYTPAQLKMIQNQIQKDFRKEHYETQEARGVAKEAEVQKEKEVQKERGNSRGFER